MWRCGSERRNGSSPIIFHGTFMFFSLVHDGALPRGFQEFEALAPAVESVAVRALRHNAHLANMNVAEYFHESRQQKKDEQQSKTVEERFTQEVNRKTRKFRAR